MKLFMTAILSWMILVAYSQQLDPQNPCTLFYVAFNGSSKGFPEFRKGAQATTSVTSQQWKVDTAILRGFGVQVGTINAYKNSAYPHDTAKYTIWTLDFLSGYSHAGEKTWAELKPTFDSLLNQLSLNFGKACFEPNLIRSPLIEGSSTNFTTKIRYLFYPASITIPPGQSITQAIFGYPYIEFRVDKSVLTNAYSFAYQIVGYQRQE